ncbi:hypothetical protein BU25DRAFT_493001 [Macroventuria anomochaeta]|uniref:Uncharacterized protein n=1 Tax=Macroventuria anomochaeta TaxID=301207 RepID=A0ACB6RTX1_9PLEO|nr:uncharacterized protein BU25DRAFT_493001 [Macroventuria anomochaeta]KAF2625366.1 hypothetical protein BU25DRAFT_493001 [Macroventuria anomochaeta]
MSPLHIEEISLSILNATLSRYPDTASSALADLDTLRYETIPRTLEKMKGEKSLLKADIEKLVEWKLKHGTYRPALMNLVKSNPADVFKSTTQEAFASHRDDGDVMKALKILTKLRGIGPATASLLLSVYQPDQVPFFSDELFRWTHWDSPGKSGWLRIIKYNVTEYKEILASVEGLRKRLGVKAVDAEKVAYVLGKGNVELDLGVDTEEDAEVVVGEKIEENKERDRRVEVAAAGAAAAMDSARTASESGRKRKAAGEKKSRQEKGEAAGDDLSHGEPAKRTTKQGVKRKAQETKPPAEGTRKSTRRK